MLYVVSSWLKRMLPDVQHRMWQVYRLTGDVGAAAAAIGVDRVTVRNWIAAQGGLRPRRRVGPTPAGRQGSARLSFADRVRIEVGLEHGESLRLIARRLGRAPSTVSREVSQHRLRRGGYSASHAHRLAWEAAARPQALKLGVDAALPGSAQAVLRARVVADLAAGRSP